MRGFMNNFEAGPVVTNMKDHFRLYPLGDQPKEINFVNVAMEAFSTLHAQDFTFFEEVSEVVQEEPNSAHSDEVLGMPAAIGIEKGKVFAPDDRMKKILSDAARVGTAAQRNIVFANRDKSVMAYPNSKTWEVGFAGGSREFLRDGVKLINERVRFHYYATGITPAMVKPPVGAGSQYMMGVRDSEGRPLGGKPAVGSKPSVVDLSEQVTYQRAFEAVIWSMPAVIKYGMRRASIWTKRRDADVRG